MSLTAPPHIGNGTGGPPGSVLDSLQRFGIQAQAELDQVLAGREQIVAEYKAKLAEFDSHAAQLRKFIRSCGLDDPTVRRPKPKTGGSYSKVRVDPQKLNKVVEAIESLSEGVEFTVLEIHEGKLGSPWADPETYKLFDHLRSIEYLARLRKDPETKRYIWKVLDRDAIQRGSSNGAAKGGIPKHASKPYDRAKAEAMEYIAANSPIEGWVEVASAVGMAKHQVGRLRDQLVNEERVRITDGPGNFKTIHWMGNAS